ncbi:hypothetical protein ACI79P_05930 [Blastococcus sp. SYSU DS0510]
MAAAIAAVAIVSGGRASWPLATLSSSGSLWLGLIVRVQDAVRGRDHEDE